MSPLVWLITGSTSGLGAALTNYIASRGDKVIATGRKVEERLGHLKAANVALLELDITAEATTIATQARKAWDIFGRIDVLINNAGVSSMRSAEEADDDYTKNMFEANLFGHMRVTRAFLPLLRSQGEGCIAFTSSSTAWAGLPFMSQYAASKAALSMYAECLHKEIAPLGLSLVSHYMANPMSHMPGDLAKAAAFMVDVVTRNVKDTEVSTQEPTSRKWAVRVALGSDGAGFVRQKCTEMLRLLDDWQEASTGTDRDGEASDAVREMLEFTTII
ncbi:unnamed protein product [Parascedosporium putredinis]|uniref:Ketoreductase domain-containing protein n=1 Tax=Parascedosporium putredinis TaxID=1442378 RepID=A0A9P1H1L8_9PEZI|nr:unnamed protein product [Parascedosporium putredinis]CAI7993916.1 unnamed protein product [Parascedosporium putredinis]